MTGLGTVNVYSVCSGAGGLDLGLERAGATIVGMCEIHPPARSILAHHTPQAEWIGRRLIHFLGELGGRS